MKYISLFITAIMLLSSGIVAADLMIYPAKGQDNATQQMSAQSQADFNRAYSICLQGRGYTVG